MKECKADRRSLVRFFACLFADQLTDCLVRWLRRRRLLACSLLVLI